LKLLLLSTLSLQGYQVFLKDSLSANYDFNGHKIGGTTSYHGVIQALGGSPVMLPPSQIYTTLEKVSSMVPRGLPPVW